MSPATAPRPTGRGNNHTGPADATAPPAKPDAGLLNLPNLITFARLCAVPVAVWLVLRGAFMGAFWLFAAAGASDALDGWLARRRGPTRLGAAMDPAADKALLVSMYVTLAAVRVLPDWLAILVVFRDLLIVGGVLVLMLSGHRIAFRPLLLSRANTGLQIVLVGVALLLTGMGWPMPWLVTGLVWLVAATTLASGAAYVWKASRSVAEKP
jgi:cardiolipin synthase